MAGVLFVICLPTKSYETTMRKTSRNATIVDVDGETATLLPNTNSIKTECWMDCDKMALENILQNVLEDQNISNAVWTKGESGNYFQVIFPLESGDHCEHTLATLNKFGIGQKYNSVVSVIPCCLYYRNEENQEDFVRKYHFNKEEEPLNELKPGGNNSVKNTVWHRFVSSVRARLIVAQVVERVKNNAALTFDFLVLLLIATTLSAIALAENNNVYLVSSMLISPMMGPVMASTFGRVIQDRNLQKTGVLNELISVGIATIIGFCYGVIITSFTDKYGDKDWPTYEMWSRGELRSLWIGGFIALLCGAAVALGILGDNIASLVGVAISVSLMPPAVNAGLLWAMAVVYACADARGNSSKSIIRTHFYSSNDVAELATLGAVSMCLTFVNIVCIYIAGILVFKIKEVAPLSKGQTHRFWQYDIKIARDYNKTTDGGVDASRMTTHTDHHLCHSLETSREHLFRQDRKLNTWSPNNFATKRPTIEELRSAFFSLMDKSNKCTNGSGKSVSWAQPECTSQPTTNNPEHSNQPKCKRHSVKKGKKFLVTPVLDHQ